MISSLSAREFSAKYPVGMSSDQSWFNLLLRWRVQGKLREYDHWTYRHDPDLGRAVRVYSERRVMRLALQESRESPIPFFHILLVNHGAAIKLILSDIHTEDKQADNG